MQFSRPWVQRFFFLDNLFCEGISEVHEDIMKSCQYILKQFCKKLFIYQNSIHHHHVHKGLYETSFPY